MNTKPTDDATNEIWNSYDRAATEIHDRLEQMMSSVGTTDHRDPGTPEIDAHALRQIMTALRAVKAAQAMIEAHANKYPFSVEG